LSPEPTSKPWTCPCGKTVHGNGGRSSHQRTCAVYHRVQRDSWARNLADFKVEGRPGHEVRNAKRMLDEHQVALDEILARTRPGADTAEGLCPGMGDHLINETGRCVVCGLPQRPEGDEPLTTPAPVEN
jgi:hypothetical protein